MVKRSQEVARRKFEPCPVHLQSLYFFLCAMSSHTLTAYQNNGGVWGRSLFKRLSLWSPHGPRTVILKADSSLLLPRSGRRGHFSVSTSASTQERKRTGQPPQRGVSDVSHPFHCEVSTGIASGSPGPRQEPGTLIPPLAVGEFVHISLSALSFLRG